MLILATSKLNLIYIKKIVCILSKFSLALITSKSKSYNLNDCSDIYLHYIYTMCAKLVLLNLPKTVENHLYPHKIRLNLHLFLIVRKLCRIT